MGPRRPRPLVTNRLAAHVGEDLARLAVDAHEPRGTVEATLREMVQKVVNSGRPATLAAADCAVDQCGTLVHAASQALVHFAII